MDLQTEVQVTTLGSLADKTAILSLDFGRFGNSRQADVIVGKLDEAGKLVETTAQQNRFNHTKKLLESPELKAIQKADNALRLWIDAQPACWKRGKSTRVVGFDSLGVILEACDNYEKITRPALVQLFIDSYLQRVAEAQAALGDKFIASEYPTIEQVKAEFTFTWDLLSFSTPDKLQSLSPKMFAKQQEKLTLAVDEWKQGRRAILQGMVSHLFEILKPEEGKKKKLHATAVTKLQEFLTTYDLNSVPDDAELQSDVTKLKLLMNGVDADKIKESDNLKAALVEGFAEIGKNLTLTVESGRKFR